MFENYTVRKKHQLKIKLTLNNKMNAWFLKTKKGYIVIILLVVVFSNQIHCLLVLSFYTDPLLHDNMRS